MFSNPITNNTTTLDSVSKKSKKALGLFSNALTQLKAASKQADEITKVNNKSIQELENENAALKLIKDENSVVVSNIEKLLKGSIK